MVTQLAAVMAVIRDAPLRERLGEIAADPSQDFLIGQLMNQSWLKVGGMATPSIASDRPDCQPSIWVKCFRRCRSSTDRCRYRCSEQTP